MNEWEIIPSDSETRSNEQSSSNEQQTRRNSFPPNVPKKSNDQNRSMISSLINKHTSRVNSNQRTLEGELLNFREINEQTDPLTFWKINEKIFSNLAALAFILLGIPMTTAKSESAFSVSGALLRDRRSTIDPLRAEKVLFLYDNYNLVNI